MKRCGIRSQFTAGRYLCKLFIGQQKLKSPMVLCPMAELPVLAPEPPCLELLLHPSGACSTCTHTTNWVWGLSTSPWLINLQQHSVWRLLACQKLWLKCPHRMSEDGQTGRQAHCTADPKNTLPSETSLKICSLLEQNSSIETSDSKCDGDN